MIHARDSEPHSTHAPTETSATQPRPPLLLEEAQNEIHTSGWIIALNLFFLGGVILVALRWADWKSFLEALLHINPYWAAAAVALQAGTYICVAYAWYSVLRRFELPIPMRSLLPLSLAKLFLDQAVPAMGLGGTALAIRGFVRRGSTAHVAVAAAAVYTFTEFLLNVFFLFSAFLILSADHLLNPFFTPVRVFFICSAVLAVVCILAYGVWNLRALSALKHLKPVAWLTKTMREIPRHTLADFGLWASVTIALAMIWVLDAGTLWALLLALDVHAPLLTILACSVISSVVALMIFIPGGLGIFEGSSIALLHLFGIPLEQAIASSVLMRGFTYWFPMIPGFLITRREFTK